QFAKLVKVQDPIERLMKCGRAYVEFGLAHPNHYQLMFSIPAPTGVVARPGDIPLDPRANSYLFVRAIVAEGMAKGLLRKELKDGELVAQMLWSGMHGIVSLHFGKKEAEFIEHKKPSALTDLMLDVLMRGLLAPGVRRPA